jgi:hypothetical protein
MQHWVKEQTSQSIVWLDNNPGEIQIMSRTACALASLAIALSLVSSVASAKSMRHGMGGPHHHMAGKRMHEPMHRGKPHWHQHINGHMMKRM